VLEVLQQPTSSLGWRWCLLLLLQWLLIRLRHRGAAWKHCASCCRSTTLLLMLLQVWAVSAAGHVLRMHCRLMCSSIDMHSRSSSSSTD
jgi:hypothetical protein